MRILLSAVLLSCVACSGDDENPTDTGPAWPTTCDAVDNAGFCYAWGGEMTADHADFQELCEGSYGGVYSDAACPGDPIAVCVTDQGFDLALDYQYYAPDWDLTTAQTHCEGLASCQFSCEFQPAS